MRRFRPHQFDHCLNCEKPMEKDDRYCSQCSQPRTDGRHSVWMLIRDFLESTFNLDARLLKTLYVLLKPAQLTIDFFEGKQIRYWQPLRLFLILAALQLTVFSGYFDGIVKQSTSGKKISDKLHYSTEYIELDSLARTLSTKKTPKNEVKGMQRLIDAFVMVHTDSSIIKIRARYAKEYATVKDTFLRKQIVLDSIQIDSMIGDSGKSSLGLDIKNDSLDFGNVNINIGTSDGLLDMDLPKNFKIYKKDILTMSPTNLMDRYQVKGFTTRLVLSQVLKTVTNDGSFLAYIFSRISWALILLMPFVAFVLEILNRRRLYFEHLIFSFHIHAFSFLISTVIFLLAAWLLGSERAMPYCGIFTAIFSLIYIYIAMVRFYKQSYIRTFLKYNVLLVLYFICALFLGLLMILFSFLFF